MELKDRIALARKQAGLSQEQLGEKLGVSRQAVSKWEAGQSNPDLTYVAEMCRLFGVSSDWLLLGEEGSEKTSPIRCPSCQTVITKMDNFCPKCGYSLRKLENGTYTLIFRKKDTFLTWDRDIRELSRTGWFSESSPLHQPLPMEQARELLDTAPFLIDRGLSVDTIKKVLDKVEERECFLVYLDSEGDEVQSLLSREPISQDRFRRPQEPLTFGAVVLAAALGILGMLILLSFL
ncbi:MAG: helix-turn-helix domain-containing protein [Lawsonibacter sp.]|nr:helix-turn-helix domain-containing protein [Lawsonibacter sp.]